MGANIARIIKARRLTQQEVANAVGVSRQSVQLWCAGGNPSPHKLSRLAEYLGVPEDQLTAEDPVELPDGALIGNGGAYYSVNKLDTSERAWAKNGALFEKLILSPAMNTIMESYGADPARLEYTVPPDDSMEPTLCRDTLCVVDRSQDDLNREGIYCFLAGNRVLLRRVLIDLETGAVTLTPDNPKYPSIPRISRAAKERIQCLGRVVYKLDGKAL